MLLLFSCHRSVAMEFCDSTSQESEYTINPSLVAIIVSLSPMECCKTYNIYQLRQMAKRLQSETHLFPNKSKALVNLKRAQELYPIGHLSPDAYESIKHVL